MIVARRARTQVGFIKRRLKPPSWPVGADGTLLIHVGCGPVNGVGFINVDAQPYPHVHVVSNDVTALPGFSDQSADLIYMCHILEHLTQEELQLCLGEMHRILKPRGVLRISVPDFDRIIDIYSDTGHDIESIRGPLLGSHANAYDIHHLVFNNRYLTDKLTNSGFREVRPWDPATADHHAFEDWASRKINQHGRAYPISLNL